MMRRSWGGVCVWLVFVGVARAQAPLGLPFPAINITNFGAKADAQESDIALGDNPLNPTTCSVSSSSMTTSLTCTNAIFFPTDVGKSIEIPTAGGVSGSPTTLLTAILAITGTGCTPTIGPCLGATLRDPATNTASGVTVTWGTDNSTAFQAASNACPPPSNPVTISPLTSKGCVFYVPNPGSFGTGDYMFGSSVSLSTQTSFQIIGMGNSGKAEGLAQSGVRLVTAMPITILSLGQIFTGGNAGFSALGGFQIMNLTFRDTSGNGTALGGLLMNGVSEALIAYCSFENFNGQQPDATPGAIALSYGMRATAYGGPNLFNNNIVLLHDKGKNNSIWYDGGNGSQDGPIIIGGDVFPTNSQNSKPATGAWKNLAGCIGIVSTGVIRLYGTHFDVGNDPMSNPCIGIVTLTGGIVSGKVESSFLGSTAAGTGIVAFNAGPTNVTLNAGDSTKNAAGYVTVTESNTFVIGQAVAISHSSTADQDNLDGTFIITFRNSGEFQYDYPGSSYTSGSTGNARPRVTTGLDVESIFNNLVTDVSIGTQNKNNKIVDYSSNNGGSTVVDNGTNDVVQVIGSAAGNSLALSGSFSPGTPGGMDLGLSSFPFANLWLGSSPTANVKVTAPALTGASVFTLPDANSNPVRPSTAPANQFATSISSAGVIGYTQPNLGNIAAGAAPTGTFDFSGSTTLKVPVAANAAPTANGAIAYDSMANNPVIGETLGGSSTGATGSLQRTISISSAPSTVLDAGTIGTTETAFSDSYQFPANYWIAGKTVRVTLGIQYVAPATGVTSQLYKVRFQKAGPTNVPLFTGAMFTPLASVTRSVGSSFLLQCNSTGASGSIYIANSPGINTFLNTVSQPVTFDTTAAQTLQVTITFGAMNAGNTSQLLILSVEEIN